MKRSVTAVIELEKVREWVSIINPYIMAIRPPKFYKEMGFPMDIIRKCVRKYRRLRLNDGTIGNAHGVSDGVILAVLAEGLGVDREGNQFLCMSNQIKAWRDACIVKLGEIASEEKQIS